LGGGGIGGGAIQNVFNAVKSVGGSTNLAGNIAGIANGFAKMAGPLLLVIGGLKLGYEGLKIFAEALTGAEAKKNAAIQTGNIEEAGRQASIQSDNETMLSGVFGGAGVGAILGGIVGAFGGPIGMAAGAAIGSSIGVAASAYFGESFASEASNTAMAFAANVKASKDLEKAQSDAAIASQKFANGTISASEYLNTFSQAGKSVAASAKYADTVVKQSTEGKSEIGSGAILRNLGAYLGGGLFGMETAATRNQRLSKEGVDVVKGQRENQAKLFESSTEARNAAIRSTIFAGGTVGDARKQVKDKLGLDTTEMRSRAETIKTQAESARKSGDIQLAGELDTQYSQLIAHSDQLDFAFENIAKEVERAKAAFNAMNLGLRGPTAAATAMSASMERFAAGFEVGGNTFVSNTEFLAKAMSGAAQAMNPNEIKAAISDVSSNLKEMGLSEKLAQKVEDNIGGFISAQQNYNNAFEKVRTNVKA
jgi:hypothetical protein